MFRVILMLFVSVNLWANESMLLSKVRQLTFEGKRSGEGYYHASGNAMIFQSERDDANPFYQIYHLDLETGDTKLVSPGYGKTTCAWIHPDGRRALFASTHLDPDARKKMQDELDFRASGQERRYAWDYDPHYDLFAADMGKGTPDEAPKRLTTAEGYDAEASYSPDGRWIAFASNRRAFSHPEEMTAKERETFERDPSYMMDLYLMPAEGGEIQRLTSARGYDGGPFFSADGSSICWRRFDEDGATAEIYTMRLDDRKPRQMTKLGAMSWAPYFHPSGEYLIFATNLQGFNNFELYMVRADGSGEPVRVTETDGFDGLPVFSPDGDTLSWTSNRNGSSQIFVGSWNHSAAMKLLGGGSDVTAVDLSVTKDAVDVADLRRHVGALTAEPMAGRMTGTDGEILATAYVAGVFQSLGLAPAGDDGYFQSFPFIAGVSLGDGNQLKVGDRTFPVDQAWRPLAFSKNGQFDAASVVFAGYGISAPAADGFDEYDSFVHLDVADKWLLVFRYMPENISPERRQHLNRFASLRYKAMVARDKGARGLLVVTAPSHEVNDELVKLAFDASLAGTSVPAISLTREVAAEILRPTGKSLDQLAAQLADGSPAMGVQIETQVALNVEIMQEERQGRNAIARLRIGDQDAPSALIIGAHVDHLGRGEGGGSLARSGEETEVHVGADDNASGVAVMLEMAQHLAAKVKAGELDLKHDILFAAWSGEELGLLGSNYFAVNYAGKPADQPLRPELIAYLNLDMVGRLEDNLVVQGLGSSSYWAGEIERRNVPVGLSIVTQQDAYLPTDATSFYVRGVPVLAAFTGSHEDYHSPRDTPEKLNYEGMRDIGRFMSLIARGLLTKTEGPEYVAIEKPETTRRAVMRAYLGTVPDYAQGDTLGVRLSGVAKNGPAEKAGVLSGDIVIELAGRKVENIYDYTYAIEALRVGQETTIQVRRGEQTFSYKVTPGSRD